MKEPETMFQFIPSWNISNNFPVIDHFPPDRKTSNNLVKQKKKKNKRKQNNSTKGIWFTSHKYSA